MREVRTTRATCRAQRRSIPPFLLCQPGSKKEQAGQKIPEPEFFSSSQSKTGLLDQDSKLGFGRRQVRRPSLGCRENIMLTLTNSHATTWPSQRPAENIAENELLLVEEQVNAGQRAREEERRARSRSRVPRELQNLLHRIEEDTASDRYSPGPLDVLAGLWTRPASRVTHSELMSRSRSLVESPDYSNQSTGQRRQGNMPVDHSACARERLELLAQVNNLRRLREADAAAYRAQQHTLDVLQQNCQQWQRGIAQLESKLDTLQSDYNRLRRERDDALYHRGRRRHR